jgi:hypothetical protein
MNKRQSTSGRILLYDVDKTFVTSKNYRTKADRHYIIATWIRIYRLDNRIYHIHIIPDIKDEKW